MFRPVARNSLEELPVTETKDTIEKPFSVENTFSSNFNIVPKVDEQFRRICLAWVKAVLEKSDRVTDLFNKMQTQWNRMEQQQQEAHMRGLLIQNDVSLSHFLWIMRLFIKLDVIGHCLALTSETSDEKAQTRFVFLLKPIWQQINKMQQVIVLRYALDCTNDALNRFVGICGFDPEPSSEGITHLHALAYKRILGPDLTNEALTHTDVDSDIKMVKFLVGQGVDINAAFPSTQSTALHLAAEYGNLSVVYALCLRNETDRNAIDSSGNAPLHIACMQKDVDVCEVLITGKFSHIPSIIRELTCVKKTADLNIRNRIGSTELHCAVTNDLVDVIRFLMQRVSKMPTEDKSSYLNAKNHQNECPLWIAIENKSITAAKLLVDNGADVNFRVRRERIDGRRKKVVVSEESLLHFACKDSSVDMVQLLIENGADASINSTNHNGDTPLHCACYFNNVPVVEYLLDQKYAYERNCEVDRKNNKKETALQTALLENIDNVDVLKIFVNKVGNKIYTVEPKAAVVVLKRNNVEAFKILLEKYDDYLLHTKFDGTDDTLLHLAAENKNSEFVKCIKRLFFVRRPHYELLSQKNVHGQNPFHTAAKSGIINNAIHLWEIYPIYAPFYVEQDKNGNTPLHLAVISGCVGMVETFLTIPELTQRSCDKRNTDGYTPLDCAVDRGYVKILDTLLSYGLRLTDADKLKLLHFAVAKGNTDTVQKLFDKWTSNVFENLQTTGNVNVLHVAIDTRRNAMAKFLLQKELNIWTSLLQKSRLVEGISTPPFCELITVGMHDVAIFVLENCIVSEIKSRPRTSMKNCCSNIRQCFERVSLKTDQKEETHSYLIENYQEIIHSYLVVEDFRCLREVDLKEVEVTCPPQTAVTLNSTIPKTTKQDEITMETPNVADGNVDKIKINYLEKDPFVKQVYPLDSIIHSNNEALMTHPVVETLTNYKWNLYGHVVFWFGLLSYSFFLISFTMYIISFPTPYDFAEIFDSPWRYCHHQNVTQYLAGNNGNAKIFFWFTVVALIFRLIFECVKCFIQKRNYICDVYKWLEIILVYFFAILFLINFNTGCPNLTLYKQDWQWSLTGVIAIVSAWINFAFMLRHVSVFGIYIIMFFDILKTYSKMVMFFIFIIAFSMGFYMLFQNQESYSSFAETLVKSLVMTLGEFDFIPTFHSSSVSHKNRVYYPTMSRILFCVFALIMSLSIMNLLVGLAVDDVRSIRKRAELKRMKIRANYVLQIQTAVDEIRRTYRFKWVQKLCDFTLVPKEVIVHPCNETSKLTKACCRCLPQQSCFVNFLTRWCPETRLRLNRPKVLDGSIKGITLQRVCAVENKLDILEKKMNELLDHLKSNSSS